MPEAEKNAFAPGFGNLVAEVAPEDADAVKAALEAVGLRANVSIGEVTVLEEPVFRYGDVEIAMDDALIRMDKHIWKKYIPTRATTDKKELDAKALYYQRRSMYAKTKLQNRRYLFRYSRVQTVSMTAAKAFERAGANVVTKVFKNLNAQDIRDSVDVFAKAIDQAQIIMFPGGFSAGDEPEGSAKFFATAFRNAKIKECC